jgi:hypothetical protein
LQATLGALWPGALPIEGIGQTTAWAVLAAAAAATATVLGAWNARRTAAVVRVDMPVPVPGFPTALHGFKVSGTNAILQVDATC